MTTSGSWTDPAVASVMPLSQQVDPMGLLKLRQLQARGQLSQAALLADITDFTSRVREVAAGLAAGLMPKLADHHLSIIRDEAETYEELGGDVEAAYDALADTATAIEVAASQQARQAVRDKARATARAKQRAERDALPTAVPRGMRLPPKLKQVAKQEWQTEWACGCRWSVSPADITDTGRADGWLLRQHSPAGATITRLFHEMRKEALASYLPARARHKHHTCHRGGTS